MIPLWAARHHVTTLHTTSHHVDTHPMTGQLPIFGLDASGSVEQLPRHSVNIIITSIRQGSASEEAYVLIRKER